MTNIKKTDLQFTDDLDIALDPSDKHKLNNIGSYNSLIQTIKIRLASSDPDIIDFEAVDFCANLEDLIGQPNTVETATLGIDKITKSLTFDNLVTAEDLYIRPTVTDKNTIAFYVFVRLEEDQYYTIEVFINLENGVSIGREMNDTLR